MAKGNKTVPIEAKSSVSSKHRSMDLFRDKYKRIMADPIIIHSKDLRLDEGILYLPIYMTSLIPDILDVQRDH